MLVFKNRGSSVLHRAAFPAAYRELVWVFTALMLKHLPCSADPLELIVQIWMSLVFVQHGPSVGVCSCYWCLASCPWADKGFLSHLVQASCITPRYVKTCRKKETIPSPPNAWFVRDQMQPTRPHEKPWAYTALGFPLHKFCQVQVEPVYSSSETGHTQGPNQSTFKRNLFIF